MVDVDLLSTRHPDRHGDRPAGAGLGQRRVDVGLDRHLQPIFTDGARGLGPHPEARTGGVRLHVHAADVARRAGVEAAVVDIRLDVDAPRLDVGPRLTARLLGGRRTVALHGVPLLVVRRPDGAARRLGLERAVVVLRDILREVVRCGLVAAVLERHHHGASERGAVVAQIASWERRSVR